jgi:hypothetical protein
MNRSIVIAVSGAVLGAVAACGAPYSVTNDLRAGMTKHQVIALMGTPDSLSCRRPQAACSKLVPALRGEERRVAGSRS